MRNRTGDPGKGRPGFRRNLLLAAAAMSLHLQGQAAAAPAGAGETADFAEILATEEAILSLTPRLKKLGRDVLNLQLPHLAGAGLFADEVSFTDLAASGPPSGEELRGMAVRSSEWPLNGAARTAPSSSLRLWAPLFDQVEYFEHARFHFERGNFLDAGRRQWEADIAFTGAARTRSGTLLAVAAKLATRWKPGTDPASPPGGAKPAWEDWRIERWHLKSLTTHEAADPLFSDVLDRALPKDADRKRARESIQEQLVVAWGRDLIAGTNRFEKPHVLFDISSLYQKPGVSVVDIDRDGYDDIYVMPSWGKNLLLHNQGDGTFRDIAAEVSLDPENFCSSAAFADFDNDGDPDVFMGRTFERSLYFLNEDGRFADRSETLPPAALPNFVASISAADYNGDGLL
ncbi:MAG: VCBS repeat-containing protein, partial [Gemmatimonadetes bacterium]|nr:VCBS repeat-containing protein [Gemmatimonadota bacterium]